MTMQMRTLGKSGLRVSRLCFGTLTMSPLQKNLSPGQGAVAEKIKSSEKSDNPTRPPGSGLEHR